jgi:hypothetical protein
MSGAAMSSGTAAKGHSICTTQTGFHLVTVGAQQDSNLRSRLRRPPLQSSEFVRSACMDSIAHPPDGQDHSAYIPDHGNCPMIARTLQGMARVRSRQALAWPLVSDRSARRGSGVKRDFACTFSRHFHSCSLSAVTVTLEAGGAGTYTQRAIPGSEPGQGRCTFHRIPLFHKSGAMTGDLRPLRTGAFGPCDPPPGAESL